MTDHRPVSKPVSERIPPGSLSESVLLLERFRAGESAAATELFERFSGRLFSLVQSRLSRKLARRIDAEDIVQSAYRSFFVRTRAGQFAVDEPGDLWRLLAQIALNKLCHSAEWHTAARRSLARENDAPGDWVSQLMDAQVSPELEVIVADQLEFLMSQLTAATCRVLELRLQGHDVDEIATAIGRSPRTVRRQLETIRATFRKLDGSVFEERPPSEATSIRAETSQNPVEIDSQHPPSIATVANQLSLNDFILRQQIGLGLTGRVYEAFDKRQQRLVAVKVLRKTLLEDWSLRERFEAEADIVSRLVHPGIVRIHGHGETPNRGWFLVMDLLPQGDLIQRAGPELPIEQAMLWIQQVAIAVRHAHREGVIHCDLKPANLLLDAAERVVVTDFGFARIRESIADRGRFIAGTPAFMAPEQIAPRGGTIGPYTDIYALGGVLFFLLTGQAPVTATDIGELFEQITSKTEHRPVTDLRPDVPSHVASFCQRCLRKSPRERFQNVDELLDVLKSSQ